MHYLRLIRALESARKERDRERDRGNCCHEALEEIDDRSGLMDADDMAHTAQRALEKYPT